MAAYRQTGKMTINAPRTINFPDPDLIKRLVVADSGFVFDPQLGKSYSINSVGLIIIKYIQEGANLDQIIAGVTKDFEVSQKDAERDILEFVNLFQGQIR